MGLSKSKGCLSTHSFSTTRDHLLQFIDPVIPGPPGIQYEDAVLQIAPVDKSKCPFIKDGNDIGFQLFTK